MKKSWKRYCKDDITKIENYELAKADDFKGWCIHHRLEFDINGNEVHHPGVLTRLGMYFHRPYFELIFMKISDHLRMHNVGKKHGLGHKLTEQHKMMLSSINKGRKLSQSTKDKISKSGTGRHWSWSKKSRDNFRIKRTGSKLIDGKYTFAN